VNTVYLPLSKPTRQDISAEQIAALSYRDEGMIELVFVDGYLAPALCEGVSGGGVHVGGLAEAIASNSEVLQRHLGTCLREEAAYPMLNAAVLQDGAFVHVARNIAAPHPIHLLFVSTSSEAQAAANPRNLIVIEEGAEADVIATYAGQGAESDYLNNVVTEVALGDNARLGLYKVVQEGPRGNHLETADVRLGRDARFHACTFSLEGRITRNKLAVLLDGEGASCTLTGVYCNDQERLTDNFVDVRHAKPHGSSRMHYKGILDGKSKAVFTGKVFVDRVAQQTDSNQLSNNLMLSDTATIDAKPQLEIYADDVKCTHGATVGPAPEEVVFYFRSRGIDAETARAMLTYGFADEIVDEIPVEALRRRLDGFVFEKYSPKPRDQRA
jgi:Fe-S cluster assembly protein SufD